MQQKLSNRPTGHPLGLLIGFWIGVAIALVVVLRRVSELISPAQGRPPRMAAVDATFSSHAFLTLLHIVPAAIFIVLAVIVLLRWNKGAWAEKSFFFFGLITGVTAYAMSLYAIGGWVERSAVFVFDTWFLISLGRAWWLRQHHQDVLKREWMTRAVGIVLGIATTRPVMGVFFATSARSHLTTTQFFGIAFWVGFTINVIVIELWLHSRRRAQLYAEA
jgi:cytochrome b561